MLVKSFPHNLNLAQPASGYHRSPGLHMSDIYGSLAKKLKPKTYDKRDKDGNPIPLDLSKMEMGLTFEELLEPALAESIFGGRPGEFFTGHEPECKQDSSCDCLLGIAYSPDHLFFTDTDVILGEFKLTWYSTKNAPFDEKFDVWLWQIKSYLYHLQLLECYLYGFFVNGDYKPPSPQLLSWHLTFKQHELDNNWAMLKSHARNTPDLIRRLTI